MLTNIANRYEVISLIGQGGMADVYKANDTILNRVVAVKVLREKLSQDPMSLVRFQREASAASRLTHPNVVDIYDVGEYDGMHYIVMEYVKGRTLKELISYRGALDIHESVNIMVQLTSAVAEAHRNNIIHRDIKPQNVLVKDDGTIKITDFGIAVANDSVQLTMNNAVMGSAHYLAPETAKGDEPTFLVDIYSLGIVLFELLTGYVPFRGKAPTEIAIKHLTEPIPYVRDLNSGIPQSLENIIIKATAKNVKNRYQNAESMLYELEHCFDMDRRYDERIIFDDPPVESVRVVNGKVVIEYKKKKKEEKKSTNIGKVLLITFIVILILTILFFIGNVTGIVKISGIMGYITMPKIVDCTQEEALEKLEKANFDTSHVTFKEVADDSVDVGKVASSSVESGEVIKKDEDITIDICKGPTFLIEDYTNQYLDTVQQELADKGVNLNYEIEYQDAVDMEAGVILSQSKLKAGQRIDPDAGETIHFVVSQPPQITISEDWVGRDVDELMDELHNKGIAVMKQEYGSDGTNKVVGVNPAFGTLYIQEGTDSVVTLYYD